MGSALLEKGDNGQKDEGFGLDGVLFNDGEGVKKMAMIGSTLPSLLETMDAGNESQIVQRSAEASLIKLLSNVCYCEVGCLEGAKRLRADDYSPSRREYA